MTNNFPADPSVFKISALEQTREYYQVVLRRTNIAYWTTHPKYSTALQCVTARALRFSLQQKSKWSWNCLPTRGHSFRYTPCINQIEYCQSSSNEQWDWVPFLWF